MITGGGGAGLKPVLRCTKYKYMFIMFKYMFMKIKQKMKMISVIKLKLINITKENPRVYLVFYHLSFISKYVSLFLLNSTYFAFCTFELS